MSVTLDPVFQEDYVEEIDPIVTPIIIATGAIVINFITFLIMTSDLRNQVKVSNELTKRLHKILKETKWVVHVFKDKSANAFAIGGKHIFVTTGLLKFLTEREVDAVMLHEVYHNKDWHVYKKMFADYPLYYIAMGVAASIVISTGLFFPAIVAFFISRSILRIPYKILVGRRHELKADKYAVEKGYGNELKSGLQKLEAEYVKALNSGECDIMCKIINKIDRSLAEHPSMQKRIEKILSNPKLEKVVKSKSFKKIREFVTKKMT